MMSQIILFCAQKTIDTCVWYIEVFTCAILEKLKRVLWRKCFKWPCTKKDPIVRSTQKRSSCHIFFLFVRPSDDIIIQVQMSDYITARNFYLPDSSKQSLSFQRCHSHQRAFNNRKLVSEHPTILKWTCLSPNIRRPMNKRNIINYKS